MQKWSCTGFVVYCVVFWFSAYWFYPYPSGLLDLNLDNHLVVRVQVKQPWISWLNRSYVSLGANAIAMAKQNTTRYFGYCMGCYSLYLFFNSIQWFQSVCTNNTKKSKMIAYIILKMMFYMMTSSNGNISRVTGHLCGEFTGPRWIPRTKASDAELWCFLWSASE